MTPAPPRLPAGACDAHLHVFDPRFPAAAPHAMRTGATAADYLALRQRLGLERAVIVQPRAHGTDNRVTLDAIRVLGPRQTRGIAVLRPDVDDAMLQSLHDGGIRGIRFSLYTERDAMVRLDMLEPLARRVAALGWHVQLHWRADQIADQRELLQRLPCTLVFDHMARLPLREGTGHPAFDVVRGLVQRGRAWVKLSGPYLNSATGLATGYADSDALAHAWVSEAPERLVWGSDWPHVTETANPPDTAMLLVLLGRWIPDTATRARVLAANAAALYGFDD
ncbi:amidohydrolase family protein [Diaphorobacter limosus]|uniref:Amidohydrolase family protein n=1 Tax=Diaphorobacter limosus TaxID=3036128 RepID=A0ABZ0J8P0_9BURK|nr:amidohydrolase family protein [Diaphorobacter sp. Y-1]WOO34283.1 amidohydrolase family protein [Diaphorobacter sp. Y-1]